MSLGKAAGLETDGGIGSKCFLCTITTYARNGREIAGKFTMGIAAVAAEPRQFECLPSIDKLLPIRIQIGISSYSL